MAEIWEVLLEALVDTAKLIPILLIVYFLIEFLEYKRAIKFENSPMLKGKGSPIMGALFGIIPQCGFSVISTDLFNKKAISIGALIAVYIATSDEAIPLMLANIESIPALLGLLGIKLVMAIAIGYLAMFLYGKIFGNTSENPTLKSKNTQLKNSNITIVEDEHSIQKGDNQKNLEDKKLTFSQQNPTLDGCCKHHLEIVKFDWLHPLVHCLKIITFILVLNIIFGIIIYFVGEENLMNFLQASSVFQPILAVLIGLIPNCAASVVLTELYLLGGLSFGSIVAGLSVNAGLGLILLLKEKGQAKRNLFVLAILILPSLLVGYLLHFLNIF